MTFDRKLGLGTDVAHLLIFDPTLLSHTGEWPEGWYADPAVWQHESAQATIAAWCTRNDGGYAVRLTTGGLTEAERPLARAAWTFPLRSTGRVLIDGDYNLPGRSGSGPGPDERAWIDLAEGLWHITVTAIEWTASDLSEDEAAKKFANYVAAFAPAGDAPAPKIARRPPDLLCAADMPANDAVPEPFAQQVGNPNDPDVSQSMPAGVAAKLVPPPGHFTSEGESDLTTSITPEQRVFDAFRMPYFMAPKLEVGAIGQICRLSGSGGAPGKPLRFSLTARATARLTSIEGRIHEGQIVPVKKRWFGAAPPPLGDYAAPLLQVRVELVTPDMDEPDDITVEAFRDVLLASLADGALAKAMGGEAGYHRLILAQVAEFQRLASFALEHLPMDASERLALAATDFAPRVRTLFDQLS